MALANSPALLDSTGQAIKTALDVSNVLALMHPDGWGGFNWLDPVSTYADIATTYATPALGDAVWVEDEESAYVYVGTKWVKFYTNPTMTYEETMAILNTEPDSETEPETGNNEGDGGEG